MKKLLLVSLLLNILPFGKAWLGYSFAQVITSDMENRAKEIVAQMTLEEKIDYISGDKGFYIRAIPRLGLPEIRMADGPQGVRNDTQSTMFPANICTTATWNRDMAYAMGKGIGRDCKARGVNIILGPGVNIYRSPLAGRSFEYTGEDPYLASESALGYVRGVQDQGIMACIKHYAANNQEWDRNYVSSDVDERTMEEIYLQTFRKAVMKGNVASVMNSYNLLNSVWATESHWLNVDVLRNQFGFKGILMSDWGAVHDALAPVNGGLDLEMPSGALMNKKNLIPALKTGLISEDQIDTMCQHIVQTIIAFGWLDIPFKADSSIAQDDPENCQSALNIAREGITLLKNKGNVLPLKGKTLVVGPNADDIVMGGGSGEVHPIHNVTLWQGLQKALGKKVTLGETRDAYRPVPASCFKADGKTGFRMDYFNNKKLAGNVVGSTHVDKLDITWDVPPCEGIGIEDFSERSTAVFTPTMSGEVHFEISGDDGYRLLIDGKTVAEDWGDHSVTKRTYTLNAEAGKSYNITVEYYQGVGGAELSLSAKMLDENYQKEPSYLAQFDKCDNIVVSLGWNRKSEGEGFDHDFSLPAEQIQLLKDVASHGKKVIVVLNGGGNPDMASIEPYADALVMAYYPGQEGGTALAEILSGKVNPSGKLPYTVEKKWEDNPTYANYRVKKDENGHTRVQYNEGIFMGYRGYDKNNTEVLYPFGFGLSYTTFAYSDIKAEVTGKDEVIVTFNVKNTGKREGKEVCEVYVTDKECSVPRPVKELKGFEKVSLKAGETKTVSVKLDKDAFSFYDVKTHSFIVEPGEFEICVGGSSQNLPLKSTINITI